MRLMSIFSSLARKQSKWTKFPKCWTIPLSVLPLMLALVSIHSHTVWKPICIYYCRWIGTSAQPHNEFNNSTRDVHCEEHWAQVNLSLNWFSHHHEMKKTNSYLEDGKKTTKPVHHVLQFQWLIENMQNTSMVV